jgi:hypothetical protein
LRHRLPGGKRIDVYSIYLMRALHLAWFKGDQERLFGLLATRATEPRVAERSSFDLDGKLVLCLDLPSHA